MGAWPIKKIGEVCDLMTGGTPSKSKPEYFDGGNIKWLVSGDIHKKEIFDCDGRITEEGLNNSSAKYLPKNSVMIALNGQGKTRGTVALLRTEATCNQSLVSINPKNGSELLPEFLFMYLHGNYEKIRAMTGDGGNDRRGLNMPLIRSIEIPIAPIPVQKRIVAILDQAFADIDRARELTERNLENARELFDSYLNQIFTQKGEGVDEDSGVGVLPVGWKKQRVGDFLTLEYGKPLDRAKRKDDGLYPAYGANGIKCRSDDFYVDYESIIVGRKGSAGEITLTEERFWPLDVTYFVKFDPSKYDLMFVYHLLAQLNLPALATGVKPGINRNNVYSIEVKTPELVEQKRIVEKIESLSREKVGLERIYQDKLQSLDELKKSILQKAFSGELTASDAESDVA